jgi:hypothetical protein
VKELSMLAQQQQQHHHHHHHFAAPHLCDLRTHISDMQHFWWLCHLNPRAGCCQQHLEQNNKLLRTLSNYTDDCQYSCADVKHY